MMFKPKSDMPSLALTPSAQQPPANHFRERRHAQRYPLPFYEQAMVRCVELQGSRWRYYDARNISRMWATQKYTFFWGKDDCGRPQLQRMSESLQALQVRLQRCGFVRVHRSQLVNLRFLEAVAHRGRAGTCTTLELLDGQRVGVSRRYMLQTRRCLQALAKGVLLDPDAAPQTADALL